MKIIEITLETDDHTVLKSWFAIDRIPEFSFDYNDTRLIKSFANCYLQFKRLDKSGVRGFGIRLHRFIIQSDDSFQKQIEDLMS